MAAVGPPTATDSDCERPNICLSNAYDTCPQDWFEKIIHCFEGTFNSEVSIDYPFKGGYISRFHSSELPWVQVELSRAPFLPIAEKREHVLNALMLFCRIALDD